MRSLAAEGRPCSLLLLVADAGTTGFLAMGSRRQVEILGSADRRPAVVHADLGVDVGSEHLVNVQLACAQSINGALAQRPAVSSPVDGCHDSAEVIPAVPCFATPLRRRAKGAPSSTKVRT